jgi:hypothetical protein
MQNRNIIVGVALVLLLATQSVAGCTCESPEGCYYITVTGEYYTSGFNTNTIDIGLKINYDGQKTTIVYWEDLGSEPAITLDTDKTVVNIISEKVGENCKHYVKIEPVFTANGNEYSPRYLKLYFDQEQITVYQIKEKGFEDNSIKATIKPVICKEEIPEFPTIALPIAAVIGLAFIFQNRRED